MNTTATSALNDPFSFLSSSAQISSQTPRRRRRRRRIRSKKIHRLSISRCYEGVAVALKSILVYVWVYVWVCPTVGGWLLELFLKKLEYLSKEEEEEEEVVVVVWWQEEAMDFTTGLV